MTDSSSSSSYIRIPSAKLSAACSEALDVIARKEYNEIEDAIRLELNRPETTWWSRLWGAVPAAKTWEEAYERIKQPKDYDVPPAWRIMRKNLKQKELLRNMRSACMMNQDCVEVAITDIWALQEFYQSTTNYRT